MEDNANNCNNSGECGINISAAMTEFAGLLKLAS